MTIDTGNFHKIAPDFANQKPKSSIMNEKENRRDEPHQKDIPYHAVPYSLFYFGIYLFSFFRCLFAFSVVFIEEKKTEMDFSSFFIKHLIIRRKKMWSVCVFFFLLLLSLFFLICWFNRTVFRLAFVFHLINCRIVISIKS